MASKSESKPSISSEDRQSESGSDSWFFTISNSWFDGYDDGGNTIVGAAELGSLTRKGARKTFDSVTSCIKRIVENDSNCGFSLGMECDLRLSLVSNDTRVFYDSLICRIVSYNQLESANELSEVKAHSKLFFEEDFEDQKKVIKKEGFTSLDKEAILVQAVLIAKSFHEKVSSSEKTSKSKGKGRPPKSAGPTVAARLFDYLMKNPLDEGRSAVFFAKQLGCSPSAIKGTELWKGTANKKRSRVTGKDLDYDDMQAASHRFDNE